MKSFLVGIKNVLLWSYRRGTWQYDVLCLLIIATIFLVPSRYFGDRDRASETLANVEQEIASKAGENCLEIEAGELQSFLQKQDKTELINSPQAAVALYLHDHLKRDVMLRKYVEFTNAQGRVGYRVWFK